jgi:hypothetical protein
MRARNHRPARSHEGSRRRQASRSFALWPYLLVIVGLMTAFSVISSRAGARGGTLQPDGRRLEPHAAAHSFTVPIERALRRARVENVRVHTAYAAAAAHPQLMDSLYCWCGCIEAGMRSALECFEGLHATRCDLCIRVALTAAEMVARGERDPGTIQREVDRRSGRRG